MNEWIWIQPLFVTGTNVSRSSLLRRKLRQPRAVAERRVEVIHERERFLCRHVWSAALWIHASYDQHKCCDIINIISTSIPALADISVVYTPPKNDKQGRGIAVVVCRSSLSAVAPIQTQSCPVWLVMDKETLGQFSEYRWAAVSVVSVIRGWMRPEKKWKIKEIKGSYV